MKKIIIKINANTNAISAKKNIRFEHELIDEINEIKSKNQSFSSWVKQACREKLRRDERLCAHDRSQPDRFVRTDDVYEVLDIKFVARKLADQGLFLQQIADTFNSNQHYKMAGKRKWTRQSIRVLLKSSPPCDGRK